MSGREAEDNDEATDGPVVGVDESGVVAAGTSEMELFRAGKLSREEFILRAAERATAHLEGRVTSERLEDMRELLRSQLLHDPTLTELVSAVGSVPSSGSPAGGEPAVTPKGA